ncbi:MAG TPA: WG repeat-containing protein, partial [Chryseosolibacter sp.]|nr:WG repeat-containing protein [Chryseosolibacter sp.]
SISMGKKTSWIDSTGRFFHRWYESRTFFSEGLAAVRLNGKWGFVDKTGKLVIPLRYDFVGNFSEGLATVTVNDKRGFIDKNGDLVIPLNYEFADSFNGGYASVTVLVNQTRKRTFIDKNGNPILEPGDYTIFNGRWKPGVVLLKNKVDGKFYFYNVRTKRFKPSRYEYIEDLSDGLRLVKVNGKYGYVDESERFVVPPKYQVAKSFNNGFARIQILNGVPLYLNRRGKIIKNFK